MTTDVERDYEIVGHSDNRERWLELRRTGIGASDAAAVLGASRWSSATMVFADKLGATEDEDSERFYWGRTLEPIIVDHYGTETGRKVERDGRLLRSIARPWQMCTLDATQTAEEHEGIGVLEVKNTRFKPDGIPKDYWIQMQHQYAVTGYRWGSFAVLVMGCEFYWADVPRDDEFIDGILCAQEDAFWQRVQSRGPAPDPDGSEASRKALGFLFPLDDGKTIVLGGEFTRLTEERERIAWELERADKRKREIDNLVRARIAEASFGVLADGRTYSYKANKNGVRTLRAPKVKE